MLFAHWQKLTLETSAIHQTLRLNYITPSLADQTHIQRWPTHKKHFSFLKLVFLYLQSRDLPFLLLLLALLHRFLLPLGLLLLLLLPVLFPLLVLQGLIVAGPPVQGVLCILLLLLTLLFLLLPSLWTTHINIIIYNKHTTIISVCFLINL